MRSPRWASNCYAEPSVGTTPQDAESPLGITVACIRVPRHMGLTELEEMEWEKLLHFHVRLFLPRSEDASNLFAMGGPLSSLLPPWYYYSRPPDCQLSCPPHLHLQVCY